jgi:DNA/RNA-binding domain of Phe-tRNA-synthetase-like protein
MTSEGWIDATVAAEFPDLRLHHVAMPVADPLGRSNAGIRERLREMSDRFTGAQAIAMRAQPIHHAQRVFFRHIGLDPDRDRPPAEAMAVERLRAGAFKSEGRLRDAITIAVMETGVPVWALDGSVVSSDLGVRPALSGEEVAGVSLPPGRLVVADSERPVAVLYGDLGVPILKTTHLVRLFSVQVAGIPSIHVEEALWTVAEIFDEDGTDS